MAEGGVNCPFYFRIGACPHRDRCSWLHKRPTISPTIVLYNMYQRPISSAGLDSQGQPIKDLNSVLQEQFEDFYEDIFEEMSKFGKILSLNVCDNLGEHLIGNIYVRFKEANEAAAALHAFHGSSYCGRTINADFCQVTDFREAICRRYMVGKSCDGGSYCNFLHVKVIGRGMRKKLFGRRSLSPPPPLVHLPPLCGRKIENKSGHGNGRRRRERRSRSPIREGSKERRAMIEMWNLERETRHL